MKRKSLIWAVFTVLLMISVSTISVINAQTYNAEKKNKKNTDIDEQKIINTESVSIKKVEKIENTGEYLKSLDSTGCELCQSESNPLFWYPGKIVICFFALIIHSILSILTQNVHWASRIFAATVLQCNWAQGTP